MNEFTFPDGSRLTRVRPTYPNEPMRRGACPACGVNIEGHRDVTAIAVVASDGHAVQSSYTTSYGHRDCIEVLLQDKIEQARKAMSESVPPWTAGTQKELLRYIHTVGVPVIVEYSRGERGRYERYRWRRTTEEERWYNRDNEYGRGKYFH